MIEEAKKAIERISWKADPHVYYTDEQFGDDVDTIENTLREFEKIEKRIASLEEKVLDYERLNYARSNGFFYKFERDGKVMIAQYFTITIGLLEKDWIVVGMVVYRQVDGQFAPDRVDVPLSQYGQTWALTEEELRGA